MLILSVKHGGPGILDWTCFPARAPRRLGRSHEFWIMPAKSKGKKCQDINLQPNSTDTTVAAGNKLRVYQRKNKERRDLLCESLNIPAFSRATSQKKVWRGHARAYAHTDTICAHQTRTPRSRWRYKDEHKRQRSWNKIHTDTRTLANKNMRVNDRRFIRLN